MGIRDLAEWGYGHGGEWHAIPPCLIIQTDFKSIDELNQLFPEDTF